MTDAEEIEWVEENAVTVPEGSYTARYLCTECGPLSCGCDGPSREQVINLMGGMCPICGEPLRMTEEEAQYFYGLEPLDDDDDQWDDDDGDDDDDDDDDPHLRKAYNRATGPMTELLARLSEWIRRARLRRETRKAMKAVKKRTLG